MEGIAVSLDTAIFCNLLHLEKIFFSLLFALNTYNSKRENLVYVMVPFRLGQVVRKGIERRIRII